jgi:dihydrofolate reductase
VILGRKTLESIGRALPGREMLVMTRDKNYQCEYAKVFHTLESLQNYCKKLDKAIFVIGGAEIYQQLLPITQTIYQTEIQARVVGDAYFKISADQFKIVETKIFEKNGGDDFAWKLHRWERT